MNTSDNDLVEWVSCFMLFIYLFIFNFGIVSIERGGAPWRRPLGVETH